MRTFYLYKMVWQLYEGDEEKADYTLNRSSLQKYYTDLFEENPLNNNS